MNKSCRAKKTKEEATLYEKYAGDSYDEYVEAYEENAGDFYAEEYYWRTDWRQNVLRPRHRN